MPLFLTSHKTPIGTLNLIAHEDVLLGANLSTLSALKASLDSEDRTREIKEVKSIPIISELISDYFDGDLSALDAIKVRQPGAHFSQAAWKAMRKVKAGKTLSYAELAERAGSPAAVRAAGSACAKNAIVLVISCHRIVKTGGSLGNYAYGLNKKEWLLRFEAAL
ncbi:MAG: methylated-DNA--[protein]-cysteine S-methyltransferase [Actinobacteria bacterium]|uniref:methylated-DNA--[protein]-cysteine S-methyltransferase n=1 Tax=freshwater metagenome TaxID=449393 RepID=A0A6J6IW59_9ZZZZ|nr:methylated-DNA--[protein]-cysteine S-methyltransferase [Actinomycetota bacterium]